MTARTGRRSVRLNWLAGLMGLAAMAAVLMAVLVARAPLDRLGHLVFDAYQRAAPRTATPDPGVALVDIDEASIAHIGQWPWPRDVMAALVERLTRMGAAAIAFDMSFSEPDRSSLGVIARRLEGRGIALDLPQDPAAIDNDLAFANVIARGPVVLGVALSNENHRVMTPSPAGFSFAGGDPRAYLPTFSGGLENVPALTAAASGIGSFSFPSGDDTVIRSMPLVAAAGPDLFPGLALEALRVGQGARGFVLRSGDVRGGGGLDAVKVGALELPSDAEGRFWLHYSGMPNMPVIPAASLLDPDSAATVADVEGRVVIVGTSAIGLRDIVATPLRAGVPGMFVHAELVDQAMTQSFLTRPDWARGAELVVAALAGLALLALLLTTGPALSGAAYLTLGAACLYGSWQAFVRHGQLLDPVPPLLMLTVVFLTVLPILLLLGNRERRFVRSAFGLYLSPALVERLSQDPASLRLGGETRDVTVLFSDIRGFTTLSEHLGPDALTELLNGFLTPMTDVLLNHDATIDKYIGDAIMAFWNAPLEISDHARKACHAALGMQAAVAALNAARGTDLHIGIGLHRGQACVGNLGSAQRFSYSAIGDTVNLASRVEGLTKLYGQTILISDAVLATAGPLAALEVDRVRVVGRAAPVTLYTLLGDETMAQADAFRALARDHDAWLRAYRVGDFRDAQARLSALADAPSALMPLHEVYRDRLAALLADPPAQWDGVFRATAK